MQSTSRPSRRCVPGPAVLGEFVLTNRLGSWPRDEWMAVLPDRTEVVVLDLRGEPSPTAIQKAVAIVQSRAYLEKRALQLLVPFSKDDGRWRLVTIDFGIEARHEDCEFLMCFAFQAANSDMSVTSPYVEVGFALPMQAPVDPVFILSVRTAAGLRGRRQERRSRMQWVHLRHSRTAVALTG